MAYYNTTNETGESLNTKVVKAEGLKKRILKRIIHCSSGYSKFNTSSSVLHLCQLRGRKYPITSIRRAISNLVSEGELVYTGEKRTGMHGSPERLVKLNTNK
jgi:hypothetical protein